MNRRTKQRRWLIALSVTMGLVVLL